MEESEDGNFAWNAAIAHVERVGFVEGANPWDTWESAKRNVEAPAEEEVKKEPIFDIQQTGRLTELEIANNVAAIKLGMECDREFAFRLAFSLSENNKIVEQALERQIELKEQLKVKELAIRNSTVLLEQKENLIISANRERDHVKDQNIHLTNLQSRHTTELNSAQARAQDWQRRYDLLANQLNTRKRNNNKLHDSFDTIHRSDCKCECNEPVLDEKEYDPNDPPQF